MQQIRKGFTFDDLSLIPQYTNIQSRLDVDTSTWLTKNLKIKIPIVNSPMLSVISYELADLLLEAGTIPIFNRSSSFDKYIEIKARYGNSAFISTGINDIEFTKRVLGDLGFDKLLLDTAYAHTKKMLDFISQIKKEYAVELMCGNITGAQAYIDTVNAGADSVRLSVGSGSACETSMRTAVGVPSMTAILECAEVAKKFKIPFIQDGGIRGSRELCLSIAGGATAIMAGKIFALTKESGAEKRYTPKPGVVDSRLTYELMEAKYKGQASKEYQEWEKGGVKEGTVPEGTSFWAPVSGSAKEVINELVGGLRSSMTYLGAKTIKEYQAKAEFISVSSNYTTERNPRPE